MWKWPRNNVIISRYNMDNYHVKTWSFHKINWYFNVFKSKTIRFTLLLDTEHCLFFLCGSKALLHKMVSSYSHIFHPSPKLASELCWSLHIKNCDSQWTRPSQRIQKRAILWVRNTNFYFTAIVHVHKCIYGLNIKPLPIPTTFSHRTYNCGS